MNKTGLSSIVTMVGIILIGVIAIGILTAFIITFVKSPKLAPAFDCVEWKADPPLNIQSACFDNRMQKTKVNILRNGEPIPLDKIEFVFHKYNGAEKWGCGEGCGECIIQELNSQKVYYFDSLKGNFKVDLNIGSCIVDSEEIKEC